MTGPLCWNILLTGPLSWNELAVYTKHDEVSLAKKKSKGHLGSVENS